ncbi:type I pantothenate kinase [Ligilactobacillus sp. WILCCON 0076]|uniref:Pantothenate kinase n=1 Tax=Ligilactobacillus ubinensis TaxID=2876789 RepID=A0A9X2FQL8_9LACO|nr:type I pantothenate kinase [Ligilactobacillus ubinensis]MCP0887901.1 type I pantothenate kinase [Ligilactobacillus ubinensis]
MENQLNYYKILRNEWKEFSRDRIVPLTQGELAHILSLNDRISQDDVKEVYMPLVHLIGLRWKIQQQKLVQQAQFLGKKRPQKVPLVIGIAGSVAVGKSTTARLLKTLLKEIYPTKKIQLITTDGFLYSTAELKRRHILARKGFPESYDMDRLLHFMDDVKNNLPAKAPVYSHNVYDIIAGEYEVIEDVDILIVEGINVLQLPSNQQLYISDYFDFSIYVDAKEELIKQWYLERFDMLLDIAKKDRKNYYYGYAIGDRSAADAMALDVWQKINHPNLHEYILPTRNRADLIMSKGKNHLISELYLKKY